MNVHISVLPEIGKQIFTLNTGNLSEERKKLLQQLIDYVLEQLNNNRQVRLNFICTHNSRRSQFAQAWAKALAAYFGIEIGAFSGGVEVTAFNPNAVEALKDSGFLILKQGKENPVYELKFSEELPPLKMFSKEFDDPANPDKGFAAVMTCSDADENCPLVPGAEKRIPLLYKDPKAFDGTARQQEKYKERSVQIAAEMKYVFEKVQQQLSKRS
ncbi:protein-tyrosine-phosphatase [Salegentibacter chungangensis]|uniref:Protein-tyrosine-phosphatase n=1 Tax=Salegentibacter chungangensis TaxID=1335724 RepID=A0ABW3NMR5_9FLAO